IRVVVAVGPRLGATALGLLGAVALGVVLVAPGTVAGDPVGRAGAVAGHVAVAARVVAVVGRAGLRQLVGLVVAEARRGAVDLLAGEAAGGVVGVGALVQGSAGAVLVQEGLGPADRVVGVCGFPDFGRAAEVTVARDGGQL